MRCWLTWGATTSLPHFIELILGLDGKTPGMSGPDAPKLWASGECQRVLDYLAQDVKTTVDVAQACTQMGT